MVSEGKPWASPVAELSVTAREEQQSVRLEWSERYARGHGTTLMYLWNDYEGKVLAGALPLQKLLRTEGRSGFFETRGRAGEPLVVRLTESLNDDDRLRARYGAISGLGEPTLQAIEGFGSAVLEATPLFYLLLEPSSESLADILPERALSPEETDEVAGVVLTALQALHAGGFVHGLVEPDSVLAANGQIKLRSDCAHPAPEAPEDRAAFAADVRGFADLLHRALRQTRLIDESDALALPEPYSSIVRQVLRGNWGLAEIAAELRRTHRLRAPLVAEPAPAVPAASAAPSVAGAAAVPGAAASTPGPASTPGTRSAPAASIPEPAAARATVAPEEAPPSQAAQLPLQYAPIPQAPDPQEFSPRRSVPVEDDEPQPAAARKSWPLFAGIGAAVVVLLLVLDGVLGHGKHGAAPAAAQPHAPTIAAIPPAPSAGPAPAMPGALGGPRPTQTAAATAAPAPVEHGHGAPVWRVVAYTYNRADEAASKARAISEHHHDLHAEVFSPSGHAPYLVTLGGGMTRPEALVLRARARRDGLARDVYVQNYSR